LSFKNIEHFELAKKGGNYSKSEGREREEKGGEGDIFRHLSMNDGNAQILLGIYRHALR
jgi:hypothetical protein